MRPSLRSRLQDLSERLEEIAALLAEPDTQADQNRFRDLSREYAQIEPLANCYRQYTNTEQGLSAAQEMLDDPELAELAELEISETRTRLEALLPQLEQLLLPVDPNDQRDIYLEIRAGAGGAEAAIFAGDLLRMYLRYAEERRWQVEILSQNQGDQGGYKEVICLVTGQGVYSRLKFESGTHRVQRVPETESQGRVHTSACTLAILPVAEAIDHIDINPQELRIDTYRSSGAGGQHVNTTDSAVRITHLPSGIVVECQDERSQHKNKAKAMAWLNAKLLDAAQSKQTGEQASQRRLQVGSGDRSERIRTYNFPQNRLTDHRINLTLYQLDEVMEGHLDAVIEPLIREYQADQLAALARE